MTRDLGERPYFRITADDLDGLNAKDLVSFRIDDRRVTVPVDVLRSRFKSSKSWNRQGVHSSSSFPIWLSDYVVGRSPIEPSGRPGQRLQTVERGISTFDGKEMLLKMLERAGYRNKLHAIAELTLFANPHVVQITQNRNVFRVIRGAGQDRGKIVSYSDAVGQVMICDNTTPADVFQWISPDIRFGNDIQCNHIYKDSKNVAIYTSLANICYTPTFLAKLTDTDSDVQKLLQYRVFDLYGFFVGANHPSKPIEYDSLKWRDFPDQVSDLERTYRLRMASSPRSRAARSAIEIGWYFSDFKPDNQFESKTKSA